MRSDNTQHYINIILKTPVKRAANLQNIHIYTYVDDLCVSTKCKII